MIRNNYDKYFMLILVKLFLKINITAKIKFKVIKVTYN